MKKTAKILAILLAVLLGMTVIVPMFTNAAPPDDGGTLTIHKYIMDDLADALAASNGNAIDATTAAALVSAGAVPVEGVTFKVYQIMLPGPTSDEDWVSNPNAYQAPPYSNTDWNELIKAFGNVAFTLDNYLAPTKIILSTPVTPSDMAPVTEFDLVTAPAATVTTGSDGSVTTANLDKGFYLVVEQPAANPTTASHEIASMSFPFIVAVPMTNPAGDGWIEDVHVYPKNGDISIDKAVNADAVFVGETVTWTVDVSVPADIMHYEQFYLTDTLDDALTYVPGSLKVYALADKEDDELVDGQLIPKTNAPATPAKEFYRETAPVAGNDFELKVEFIIGNFAVNPPTYTVDGRNWLFGDFDGVNGIETAEGEFGVKFVRFVFDTIVNEKVLDREAGHLFYTLGNDAEINFKHRFDNQGRQRETEETTEIHTAALILNKVNAHTGDQLAGAEFQIASSDAKARAGEFLRRVIVDDEILAVLDVGETFTAADGTAYTYAAATPWIETSALAVAADYDGDATTWALVDGKVVVRFEGLKEFTGKADDVDPGYLSYYAVETKAPAGFNLLFDPIRLTFTGDKSQPVNWYTLDGGVVRNTNTFTLPRTGGIGTVLFTAGGIALIGLAALLFIVSAKKKKQKAQG